MNTGMTWQQWQGTVIALLQTFGFKVAHFRPALTRDGRWTTPGQADSKGWPDVVAINESGRMIVAELKTGKGKLTPEQKEWLEYFRAVPGVEVYEWHPDNWDQIEAIVRGGKR